MKLIFLDVDGVLNCLSTKARIEGYIFVADEMIELLKQIVDATNAKIVLSSTWRRGWYCKENVEDPTSQDLQDIRMFDALEAKIHQFGMRFLSYTEDFGPRGLEIQKWLNDWKEVPVTSFVILDDFDERELYPFGDRLVQTAFYDGLTEELAEQAIEMLNE